MYYHDYMGISDGGGRYALVERPMLKKSEWMKRKGDFFAIALISEFITALIYIIVADSSPSRPAKPFNFGFSSPMDCEPVGLGEPVCVRRR